MSVLVLCDACGKTWPNVLWDSYYRCYLCDWCYQDTVDEDESYYYYYWYD